MIRSARGFIAALLVSATAAGSAHAANRIEVAKSGTPQFPERSYVVTFPSRVDLRTSAVRVTENGEPVKDVRISAAAASARSAVILAIDTSESMHGGAIEAAMEAARAFAERRRPDQRLGVLFFSRESTLALPPTDDAAAIAGTLEKPPPLSKGTRLFDAAGAAVRALTDAEADAGSVIVLSDGADVGSDLEAADVTAAAEAAGVSVLSVGLTTPSFRSESLRLLARDGGDYLQAGTSADLSAIYARLGERFANQYLVSYRSTSALGTRVAVEVEVDGIGSGVAAYETPRFSAGTPVLGRESMWTSTAAAGVAALLAAFFLGLAGLVAVRPLRVTTRSRIAAFVVGQRPSPKRGSRAAPAPPLEAADRHLERFRGWTSFKLDMEIAQLKIPAIRLALVSVAASGAAVGLGVMSSRTLIGVMLALLVPVLTWLWVRMRADRARRQFAEQLPDNLQVLASALRAGHSFVGALSVMVEDAAEPSRTEYRRVVTDEQLGVPIEDSLKVVGERMKNEEVAYIGLIATLQRETGGNTAEVIDRVTQTVRERMRLRRLVRTLTAQGRLGGWIVTSLPIAMVILLNIINPEYMDPMLEETMGKIMLVVGFSLVVVGALCIRRIVDIKV